MLFRGSVQTNEGENSFGETSKEISKTKEYR